MGDSETLPGVECGHVNTGPTPIPGSRNNKLLFTMKKMRHAFHLRQGSDLTEQGGLSVSRVDIDKQCMQNSIPQLPCGQMWKETPLKRAGNRQDLDLCTWLWSQPNFSPVWNQWPHSPLLTADYPVKHLDARPRSFPQSVLRGQASSLTVSYQEQITQV